MDRLRVWPDFDARWVLYEDDDLIAVHKPPFLPCQSADEASPDDLVTRLRRWLVTRAEALGLGGARASSYLGVHQRLDRDTSGVVVMTRRKEANPSVARQFEGRSVVKRYTAGVVGWKGQGRRGGEVTLRDVLGPGRDGLVAVVPARDKRGKPAVTHVKTLETHDDRALLSLTLETGRSHQARVQLAHAGAAIAGDTLYGGPPAPRLMLHASALSLAHPTTGRRTDFVAETPREMASWLRRGDPGVAIFDDPEALDAALVNAVGERFALGRSEGTARATTAFRLVNEEGDAMPGLAVDVYGDHLVAHLYEDDRGTWKDDARRERVLDRLGDLGFDGVYLKIRPKQANTLVDTRREELAPDRAVRGAIAPEDTVVVEEGIPYGVRLGDGLSTGLFLDQRTNRRRVREAAAGKRVLNLFAYTCGFSVAAAVGGARRTVSVDAAGVALERGRANLARVGATHASAHALVAADVFEWLAEAARQKERFDLVLLDPPSYSTTKAGRFVGRTDYDRLVALALAVVAPGGEGVLLACSNHRQVSSNRFRKFLYDGAKSAGRTLVHAKDVATPRDFPPPFARESHLKSVWVTVG
jgi:23S rRNA (cytosine1962-C5)-methyltransferase